MRVFLFLLAAVGALDGQSGSDGKRIFEGKGRCLECHSIDNQGGALGPDLTEIGIMRSPESLRLALTDPSAEISPGYSTIVAVTNQDRRFEGIALNEDDISIQLRTADGMPRSFLKESLRELQREERSLMPPYAAELSPAEIDSLVAYLGTLKGNRAAVPSVVHRTRDIAEVSENFEFLDAPERDRKERPEALLDALEIRPGSAVADLGAGTGYFTWRLAQRVGKHGKVLAVDIQQQMLDRVAEDVKARGLGNVKLVLAGKNDPHLPEQALDLVFIAHAYHEFAEPEATMAAVRRSLKPGGRVVVIEYALEGVYSPVPGLHKMSFQDIRSEIEPVGFALDRSLDILPGQHCLIFVAWR
jgi:putative heme-binding domain-containing protein